MTHDQFEEVVQRGIHSLPEWVKNELTNVLFLILDEPGESEKSDTDEVLFGLYEGVPLSDRGDDTPLLPDVITLFRKPILDTYHDAQDIEACVRNTIWHEVAHYIGHDEEWIRNEEVRRGKIL